MSGGAGPSLPRRLVRRIRRLWTPPASPREDVLVEEHVTLDRCTLLGPVTVGFRSYANDSLLRNVTVGRFCSIGRRCSIGAALHAIDRITTHPRGAPELASPQTRIGNDVWIGDNVVVIAGVEVGDGCVIGAGAIVTKSIAPYTIVAGVPARPLRRRFSDAAVERLLASRWWDYGDAAIMLAESRGLTDPLAILELFHADRLLPAHHLPLGAR